MNCTTAPAASDCSKATAAATAAQAQMPPIVHVIDPPDPHLGPGQLGDLALDAAHTADTLIVFARWRRRSPRLADLVSDILDNAGRVGVQNGVRRYEREDLTLLLPYLLTDPYNHLVVIAAECLHVSGLDDLIAISSLAGYSLTLVLSDQPAADIHEYLNTQVTGRQPFTEAARHWHQQRRLRPARDNRIGRAVATTTTTASAQRRDLAARLQQPAVGNDAATSATIAALCLEDAHTRTHARAAKHVLQRVGIRDPERLAALNVADVAEDGSSVRGTSGHTPVPTHLRRALQRQRLHALVLGQAAGDAFLTVDGSRWRPNGLS